MAEETSEGQDAAETGAAHPASAAPEETSESFKPPTFLEAIKGVFPRQSLQRRPRARPASGTAADAAAVNNLDRRERLIAGFLALFQVVLGVVVYLEERRFVQHATKKISVAKAHQDTLAYHHAAPYFLVVNVLLGILIAGGVAAKRRALVGFGVLLGGLALLSEVGFIGVIYLGIGIWLIFRAMKRNPAGARSEAGAGPAPTAGAAGRAAGQVGPAGRRASREGAAVRKPPPPSKRYTPPRPARRPAPRPASSAEPEKESRLTSWLRR